MIVDSYRFLPRSFRPLYEGVGPFPGEQEPVWAPPAKRLADSRVALLTSAGLYLKESQPAFDLEAERARPEWGDPSYRVIPASSAPEEIGVAHLHINPDDLESDPEVALPARALARLAADRVVGSAAANHLSLMGYQERSLEGWREQTLPAIAARLRADEVDALVLAPA